MPHLKVGTVTHYYDKIGVAVVDLVGSLNTGDSISVSGSADFSQTVDSIQMDHEQVSKAKKGDTVGLKIKEPVKPGDEITRVS